MELAEYLAVKEGFIKDLVFLAHCKRVAEVENKAHHWLDYVPAGLAETVYVSLAEKPK